MDLLVFGASGRTGRRVLAAARAQGVHVRAFVRDRASVDASIDTIVGDVTRLEDVAAAVRPNDAVVSALGGDKSAQPGHAMSGGMANIVAAMRAASASRVVAVAGAGVLQADVARKRHELKSYPAQFRAVGAEHQAMLAALEASPLAWLLVCTPDLVEGDAQEQIHAMRDFLPNGSGRVTTGDVAALLLREALTPTHQRTRLGVNGV